MTPSASPRCLRHPRLLASCPACMTTLRVRVTEQRATTPLALATA